LVVTIRSGENTYFFQNFLKSDAQYPAHWISYIALSQQNYTELWGKTLVVTTMNRVRSLFYINYISRTMRVFYHHCKQKQTHWHTFTVDLLSKTWHMHALPTFFTHTFVRLFFRVYFLSKPDLTQKNCCGFFLRIFSFKTRSTQKNTATVTTSLNYFLLCLLESDLQKLIKNLCRCLAKASAS
jgi:hypothetical protein